MSEIDKLPALLYALLISVSLMTTAHAILDEDADGMSDVWEAQHGFSTSGNTDPRHAPAADPDGDGFSNLLESVAGTDPLSADPPLGSHRLSLAPNALNPLSLDLHWPQFVGKQYQVQSSTGLAADSWTPLDNPFTANFGGLASFTTPPRSAAIPINFHRVSVTDLDSDSDGLTNSEESVLNTDPDLPDSDGDGIPDKDEILQGGSPTDASDAGLPPPAPALLPLKLRIYTSASLAADYVNGGSSGLLTPYRIKIYQQNLATGVETLVHTTPDYGGTMFSMTNNVELPNIANDPTRRYTAQIDLPNIGTGIFDQPYRRWSFFLTITANVGSGPFLAANGFEPISQTYGTPGHILRAFNIYNPAFENYRAGIESVEVGWKAIIGFNNISPHIDPWNKPIAGTRIFPCFKNPLDTVIRHKLELVVKTSAAMAGKAVFVKAFDVDDSTSEEFDTIDGGLPVIDINGKSGNDNLADYLETPPSGQFWTGAAWGPDSAQGIVGSDGETRFIFRVGMQPGSNYRVVASVIDQTSLTGIQVTTSTASKYLGPELSQTAGAQAASPLLTVWRRLWVENDSMSAIPVDEFGYQRNDLSWNLDPAVIRNVSFASETGNTSFGIDAISDQSSFLDLEHGRMIAQSITHPVISTASFSVRVAGDYSSVPVNSGFRLYDDDDFGLVAPSLARNDLVDDFMKSLFKSSFIAAIDSGGFNLNKTVPFRLNDDLQGATVVNIGKDLTETKNLWVSQITAAYQYAHEDDGDPNSEESPLAGGTRRFGNYDHSTVFVEACRESYNQQFRLVAEGANPQIGQIARQNLNFFITAIASHEMGHQPGNLDKTDQEREQISHAEGMLMRGGGANQNSPVAEIFSPITIHRFRKALNWSAK